MSSSSGISSVTIPSDIAALRAQPWSELQRAAWAVRQRLHPPSILFAVPGAKGYATEHYRNTRHRFSSISLTGAHCDLLCEHCRGRLLRGMRPAPTPEDLLGVGRALVERGCEGVLISGGADVDGAVPLQSHLPAIAELKALGLKVIVHTGLLGRSTARSLRQVGVDQVLFDVVGDEQTIRQVLHLDRQPEDYEATLSMLCEEGLSVAPHIILGLHYGQMRGELNALDIVRRVGADVLVLVVLRPLSHTPMSDTTPVAAEDVGRFAALARLANPRIPLSLGCARPPGHVKVAIERYALLAGVNRIAYPDSSTVELAARAGLQTSFVESCCTLPPAVES